MLQRGLLVVIGIAALVLNPFYGCEGDPEFRYTADEMRAAIEGTWKVTVHATATTPAHEIVLSISQSAEPRTQHSQRRGLVSDAAACQTRSLVRSAGACADMSEMPLDVKLLAGGAARKGMFLVPGLTFQFGMLEATLGAVTVMAKVSPSGAIISVDLGGTEAGASMVRMSQP